MGNATKFNLLVQLFTNKPYYLEMGAGKLSEAFDTTREVIYDVKREVKSQNIKLAIRNNTPNVKVIKKINNFDNSMNVLVIGDTHIPYEHPDYLSFCKDQYDRFNCDTVVHIGDVVDSHATSHHNPMADAYGPGDELEMAIKKLKKWYRIFPEVNVCIGNHDERINILGNEAHIASKWFRKYADVLEVPNWNFDKSFEINNITYVHGTGTTGVTAAKTRALNIGQSVVMGHLHSEASIQYQALRNSTIFGMIVGCGVDENSYGMNYSKNFPKKSILSCGVILGNQPLLITM